MWTNIGRLNLCMKHHTKNETMTKIRDKPVTRLPVARLPVARLPVARLPCNYYRADLIVRTV